MRKLFYFSSVSLDGYIARPDGDLDWVTMDEELHTYVNDLQRGFGAYLHGRRIYEMMAAYWPTADADPAAPGYIVDFAHIWKSTPKIVFSKTLKDVAWNSRLVRDDAAGEVARLKAEPGGDLEVGGATLAGELHRRGLIDEYQLFVEPVVLGRGIRLFPELSESVRLQLVETRTFASGVVYLHYRRS